MDDRVTRARLMLTDQLDRLRAVIAADAFICTTSRARELLLRVNWWLNQPVGAIDEALGDMGPNGYARAIDDVCRDSAWHQANSAGRDMSLRAVLARSAARRAA